MEEPELGDQGAAADNARHRDYRNIRPADDPEFQSLDHKGCSVLILQIVLVSMKRALLQVAIDELG
jgi:hypothetical protein